MIKDRVEANETVPAASTDDLMSDVGLLRAVLESTADGILVVGERGEVVTANKRFAELWRIPEDLLARGDDEALIANVVSQLTNPDQFVARIKELYGSPNEDTDTLIFKDDRVFERYSSPLIRDGRVSGRVWSFRDITARRRAEESRIAVERKMRQSQKLESLGVLAGGIAHDFNNLLVSVLGHADLAAESLTAPAPALSHIEAIVSASKRAAEMCALMLAYSGKGRFVIEAVDWSALVKEMSHLLRVSLQEGVSLRLDLSEDLGPVEGDIAQLQQVVMNLVTNASDAVGERTGSISLTTGTVYCDEGELASCQVGGALPPGEYIFLEVRDDGCGMSEDVLSRIFDPFYSTKMTGRGLGLAATQGIVRGHNGALKVESTVGGGTTFTLLLPPSTKSTVRERGEIEYPRRKRVGEGCVLVVDDDLDVREVAVAILNSRGFSTLEAVDGEEALRIFEARRSEIRLVLLDLTMPRLGGTATFRLLRELDPDIRVLLMSGYNAQDTIARFAGQKLSGFLPKPFTMDSLLEQVFQVLEDECRS